MFDAPADAALPAEDIGAATTGDGAGMRGGGATIGEGIALKLGGERSPFGLLASSGGSAGGGGSGITMSISSKLSLARSETRIVRPANKA